MDLRSNFDMKKFYKILGFIFGILGSMIIVYLIYNPDCLFSSKDSDIKFLHYSLEGSKLEGNNNLLEDENLVKSMNELKLSYNKKNSSIKKGISLHRKESDENKRHRKIVSNKNKESVKSNRVRKAGNESLEDIELTKGRSKKRHKKESKERMDSINENNETPRICISKIERIRCSLDILNLELPIPLELDSQVIALRFKEDFYNDKKAMKRNELPKIEDDIQKNIDEDIQEDIDEEIQKNGVNSFNKSNHKIAQREMKDNQLNGEEMETGIETKTKSLIHNKANNKNKESEEIDINDSEEPKNVNLLNLQSKNLPTDDLRSSVNKLKFSEGFNQLEATKDANQLEFSEGVNQLEATKDANQLEFSEGFNQLEATKDANQLEVNKEINQLEATKDANQLEVNKEINQLEATKDANQLEVNKEINQLEPSLNEENTQQENHSKVNEKCNETPVDECRLPIADSKVDRKVSRTELEVCIDDQTEKEFIGDDESNIEIRGMVSGVKSPGMMSQSRRNIIPEKEVQSNTLENQLSDKNEESSSIDEDDYYTAQLRNSQLEVTNEDSSEETSQNTLDSAQSELFDREFDKYKTMNETEDPTFDTKTERKDEESNQPESNEETSELNLMDLFTIESDHEEVDKKDLNQLEVNAIEDKANRIEDKTNSVEDKNKEELDSEQQQDVGDEESVTIRNIKNEQLEKGLILQESNSRNEGNSIEDELFDFSWSPPSYEYKLNYFDDNESVQSEKITAEQEMTKPENIANDEEMEKDSKYSEKEQEKSANQMKMTVNIESDESGPEDDFNEVYEKGFVNDKPEEDSLLTHQETPLKRLNSSPELEYHNLSKDDSTSESKVTITNEKKETEEADLDAEENHEQQLNSMNLQSNNDISGDELEENGASLIVGKIKDEIESTKKENLTIEQDDERPGAAISSLFESESNESEIIGNILNDQKLRFMPEESVLSEELDVEPLIEIIEDKINLSPVIVTSQSTTDDNYSTSQNLQVVDDNYSTSVEDPTSIEKTQEMTEEQCNSQLNGNEYDEASDDQNSSAQSLPPIPEVDEGLNSSTESRQESSYDGVKQLFGQESEEDELKDDKTATKESERNQTTTTDELKDEETATKESERDQTTTTDELKDYKTATKESERDQTTTTDELKDDI